MKRRETGNVLLQGNEALLSLRNKFTEAYREEREKYLRDKDYFRAMLEVIGMGYRWDEVGSVVKAVESLKACGYAYYIVNNETGVSDFGVKRFAFRYEMDKKRLIAKIGVAPHILKEVMRILAPDVPTGILVMKKKSLKHNK